MHEIHASALSERRQRESASTSREAGALVLAESLAQRGGKQIGAGKREVDFGQGDRGRCGKKKEGDA